MDNGSGADPLFGIRRHSDGRCEWFCRICTRPNGTSVGGATSEDRAYAQYQQHAQGAEHRAAAREHRSIELLNAIEPGEPADVHFQADQIVMESVSPALRAAWLAAVARVGDARPSR